MSTGRRFTAEEINSMADGFRGFNYPKHWPQLVEILDQAAKTEAQVMGLVEAVEELLPIAISSESNGPVERERIREAREALTKFRGEA